MALPATDLTQSGRRTIALWLFICAGLVFAMVLIGGITRLTESGLSIVEWQPLIGAIPPLTDSDWQALFQKYQSSPQFRQLNAAITLGDFKTIFWWEYVHRLWGRLIGVAFLAPYLFFLWRGDLRGSLAWKLGGVLALGGLQGAMGWYMVQSGLVDRPEVSQYRLTAHFSLAVLIYALLLWSALSLWRGELRTGINGWRRRGATVLLVLISLTMLAGAFVAGLDAGLIYNTFPLMEGHVVPPDYGALQPWWLNPFENRATVQFHHRWLAIGTVAAVLYYAWRFLPRDLPRTVRTVAVAMVHIALVQVALGIATLLLAVPLPLALVHQAGAMALFTAALWLRFELRK